MDIKIPWIAIIVLKRRTDSYRIAADTSTFCIDTMPSDLERLRHELQNAIANMSDAPLERSLVGKWSAAQVLEHLYLTYQGTNRGLAKCLEKGTPLVTHVTLKQRIGRMVVINLGHMPGGAKSPERAVPRGIPTDEVRSAIFGEILKMEAGFNDCERRFGSATEILDHPFLGPLTAWQWRRFHWVHGRHHARQIRERSNLPESKQ